MKKILLPLSLISVLSLAQQNTGINTTNPQATLEVASKTENTTNEVEGLLIPRVSKQKALLMAQNQEADQPEESTLIYINNLADFVDPADGTETTVAAITENGFYHWNGIEWVKQSGKDGGEWVYDGVRDINLKRVSEQDNREILYSEDGKFYKELGSWDYRDEVDESGNPRWRFDPKGSYPDFSRITSEAFDMTSAYGSGSYAYYPFKQQSYTIEQAHANGADGGVGKDYAGISNSLFTSDDISTNGLRQIFGILNSADLKGNYNNVKSLFGASNAAYSKGSGSINYMYGSRSGSYYEGSANIQELRGAHSEVVTSNESNGEITNAVAQSMTVSNKGQGNITNVDGIRTFVQNTGKISNRFTSANLLTRNLSRNSNNIIDFIGIDNLVIDNNSGTYTNDSYTNSIGIRNKNLTYTEGVVDKTYGIYSRNGNSSTTTGLINNLSGAYISNELNGVRDVTDMIGVDIFNRLTYNSTNNTINNRYGLRINNASDTGVTTTINNDYGLYIRNVDNGTNNYSIYTGAGDIRFGDLTGTGERIVTADANGVLSTSTQSLSAFTSLWGSNESQGITSLKNYSDNLTERNQTRNILIDDLGRLGLGYLNNPNAQGPRLSILAPTNIQQPAMEIKNGVYSRSDNNLTAIMSFKDKNDIPYGVLGETSRAGKVFGINAFNDYDIYIGTGTRSQINSGGYSSSSALYASTTDDFDSRFLFVISQYEDASETTPIEHIIKINSSGNMSIGFKKEYNPTVKLDVAGNVRAENFISTIGTSVQFPDYVFQNYYNGASNLNADYKFKTLGEVEAYIKENGHLPGYVSAEEVEKAGQFDMTATQLTNVEKIEELYLHSIEQEKKIQAQEDKLEQQASEIAQLKALVNQLINK